jgi:hypothetical protein
VATNSITTNTANPFVVNAGASATFQAGVRITLQPGFHAALGSAFHAFITGGGTSQTITISGAVTVGGCPLPQVTISGPGASPALRVKKQWVGL